MRLLAVAFVAFVVLGAAPQHHNTVSPELLICNLDRLETVSWNPTFKRATSPLRTIEGVPHSEPLAIVGLGSNSVTAKARTWALVKGAKMHEMLLDQSQRSGEPVSDWYYTRTEQGPMIIEVPIKGRPYVEVHLYSLGMNPYTYVGSCR